ncbi:hypothetical protein [Streptomyces sp. 8N706]|uniref:hypothetical protein n=1 Tax=Streptomyces sp. 8N706 TaxID=3457416 RepID=UPI003FD43E08
MNPSLPRQTPELTVPQHTPDACPVKSPSGAAATDTEHPQPTSRKNSAPHLSGFLNTHHRGTDLHVWCTWCCHWHTHGGKDIQAGHLEHRLAHCYAKDSPYRSGGYWIKISATPWRAVRGTLRSATAAQQRALWRGRMSPAVKALRGQPAP